MGLVGESWRLQVDGGLKEFDEMVVRIDDGRCVKTDLCGFFHEKVRRLHESGVGDVRSTANS